MHLNAGRTFFLVVCFIAALATSGCDHFASPSTHLERARELVAKGDRRSALVELKNALRKQPDLHEGRLLLADIALWLGDPISADEELRRVPATVMPAAAEELGARINLALGRSEQLLERLAQAESAMSPARQELYRGLALLEQRKSFAEAEDHLRKAIDADSTLMLAHAALVQVASLQGSDTRALELSEQLTRKYPDSAEIWLARGILLARRDAAAGVQAFERAKALAPNQLDVPKQSFLLTALVDLHLASGRVDAAKANSEELQRLTPRSPLATLTSSRVAMASNDYMGAATELRRLVNAAPRFVQARFMLGVALAAQGNLEQASQELTAVIEQAPEFLEARQLLGQLRLRLSDPDGALQVLVPGLQSGTFNPQLVSLIDAARGQEGGKTKTIEVLERQLASDPENSALQAELASAYLQSGAAPKALALLRNVSSDPRREALALNAALIAEGPSAVRARIDALLASRPQDAKLYALAAAYLATVDNVEAARRLLHERISATPQADELYFALAQLEWRVRQPLAARDALQKLLARHPQHSQAQLALAEIEVAAGNRSHAEALLEDVRRRDPRAERARLLLADLALARGDAARAASLIDEALKVADNKAELQASAGFIFLNAGRYDQAIQHLQEGIKADADAPALWLLLGRAQLALNQHGAARESFERALKLRPNWLAAEGALVFLDLQLKDSEAALRRVADLKQARPKDASVAALEGQVLFALRRYADAAAAFDRAAEIEPSGALAANSYEARVAGKLSNPTAPLEKWLDKHPDDAARRLLLAEGYTRAGDRRRAVQQYESVVSKQPQNVHALNNLAWLCYELKDGRAIEFARRASAAAPNSATVSDTLGWILVETGAVSEGLPILERATGQAAAEPEIGFHYAVALLRSGQREKATGYLRRLLKEHPAFPSRPEAERLVSDMSTVS